MLADAKNKKSVDTIAEILKAACRISENAAEKVLETNKNLDDCFEKMKSIASREKSGNCYYMGPVESLMIIKEFFSLDRMELADADLYTEFMKAQFPSQKTVSETVGQKTTAPAAGKIISIFDLMED
mgnify:CR=1 FL=1